MEHIGSSIGDSLGSLSGEECSSEVVTIARANCHGSNGVRHCHLCGYVTSKYIPSSENPNMVCKLVQGQALLHSGISPPPPTFYSRESPLRWRHQFDIPEIFEVSLIEKDVKRLNLTASFVRPLLGSIELAEAESTNGSRSGFWYLWDIYNEPFPG